MRGTNRAIRLQGCVRSFPKQGKTFASAIKRFWPGKAAPRATWSSRTRKRAQLSPGKGYLIGNESEIWNYGNACFVKGK